MIRLQKVSKSYELGQGPIVGLQEVSLDLEKGDFVQVRGPSGSGKTTLLLTIGGMQRPDSGRVGIGENNNVYALSPAALNRVRAQSIGFIFQLFHLVPYLDVFDNIQLGVDSRSNSREATEALVEKLGLTARLNHKPAQLSVGECQRVAVARALVSRPEVLLADEPTGNLDAHNAEIVTLALREFSQGGGVVVLASHSDTLLKGANRLLQLEAGVVKECEFIDNVSSTASSL